MTGRFPLRLFQGFGIELEYMIVRRDSLAALPIADEVLRAVTGEYGDYEGGAIAWSNELVLHVIELKTNGPAPALTSALARAFHSDVRRINGILAPLGGMLLPTAMHPTFDPATETRIWQHDYSPVYAAYDRIFDCRGHGWSNLQSMHINLPFGDDAEFGRLHAAIRAVLPLLPALAASSPIVEGRLTGLLDNRLDVYQSNQRRIPSLAGRVIPEAVYSEAAYREQILERSYGDIAPHDPDGILRDEFLNSRGAIARFSRGAIEIRVIDLQESPLADLALARLATGAVEMLARERFVPLAELERLEVEPLRAALLDAIARGERAEVTHAPLLRALGLSGERAGMDAIWRHLYEQTLWSRAHEDRELDAAIRHLIESGPLARRIARRLGPAPARAAIEVVYRELADVLADGRQFA